MKQDIRKSFIKLSLFDTSMFIIKNPYVQPNCKARLHGFEFEYLNLHLSHLTQLVMITVVSNGKT
jgi:hypothetical protein